MLEQAIIQVIKYTKESEGAFKFDENAIVKTIEGKNFSKEFIEKVSRQLDEVPSS